VTYKAVVLGAGGQLGRELIRTVPANWQCVPLARAELDIGEPGAVLRRLAEIEPRLVINAAAYTAVDQAESDAAEALRINAEGPAHVAAACSELGARLLQVSTDFVFDGKSSVPYLPGAPTSPLGEYGRSKLLGEQAVQRVLPDALIMRTAWVYSVYGANFVKTMLRLMAEREHLTVVADQVGTPTWARGLADALWRAADREALTGVYHWTDAGVCSWYDFAVAIAEEALALGILSRPVDVRPIPGADYPTPAQRPGYSVLDKSSSWRDLALEGRHWRSQLRAMLREYKETENA
jgi:dTDP-4-dehydrorhamnose reductase